jgi:hypothetical protein
MALGVLKWMRRRDAVPYERIESGEVVAGASSIFAK